MRFLRLVLPILVLVTGCKQQLGDRCQVDGDCAEGRCSTSDHICRLQGDETVADAGPADASTDASLDEEELDAAVSTPDAAEPDGAVEEADAGEPDAGEADAGE